MPQTSPAHEAHKHPLVRSKSVDDRSLPETDSKFNNPPDRNAHPEIELVSEPKLCALLGNISSTTLWRQRRAGNFPKPIRILSGQGRLAEGRHHRLARRAQGPVNANTFFGD
jgi:predicted DNA-binding transcriptional regulator AlpA